MLVFLCVAASACQVGASNAAEQRPAVSAPQASPSARAEDELRRMPPYLREQFQSENGQRELQRALDDKGLLAQEARLQGLHKDPLIHKQVAALEERLIIQALVEREARTAVAAMDARSWFDQHKQDFKQPPRWRVARVLAKASGNDFKSLQQARARAEAFRKRLQNGQAVERVAAQGEGPEAQRNGDMGLRLASDVAEAAERTAMMQLQQRHQVSAVVDVSGGAAVLVLTEFRPGRIPSFEEVRPEVEARLAARVQRQTFEDVIRRLRAQQKGAPP